MLKNQGICLKDMQERYIKGIRYPECREAFRLTDDGISPYESNGILYVLEGILKSFSNKRAVNVGSIGTVCVSPEKDSLETYIGGRILVAVYALFLYRRRAEGKSVKEYANLYNFESVPCYNEVIQRLLDEDTPISQFSVSDFKSSALKTFIVNMVQPEYKSLPSDYLLTRVFFTNQQFQNLASIEEYYHFSNDEEPEESSQQYIKNLNNHVMQLYFKSYDMETYDILAKWSANNSGKWLNFFGDLERSIFRGYDSEAGFIKYCLNMCLREVGKTYTTVECITADMIVRVHKVMEYLTSLDLNLRPAGKKLKEAVYYSWTRHINVIDDKYGGAFWGIGYEDYDNLILYVLDRAVSTSASALGKSEILNDIVFWGCLTSKISMAGDYRAEYLRFLCLVANHNVAVNTVAWYEGQCRYPRVYYGKYTVYGVPQYYGEHALKHLIVSEENKSKLDELFRFNRWATLELHKGFLPVGQSVVQMLMADMCKTDIPYIKEIAVKREKLIRENRDDIPAYYEQEAHVVGIIDKLGCEFDWNKGYLEEVKLTWLTRKRTATIKCKVRLLSLMDILYEEPRPEDDEIVRKSALLFKDAEETVENEFIQKCIWSLNSKKVAILYKERDGYPEFKGLPNDFKSLDKVSKGNGWCDVWTIG